MKILAMIAILTACGTEQAQQAAAPAATPAAQADKAKPEAKADPMLSMALESAKALPECNHGHEGQLVYLKAEKQFMTCQDSAWVEIDIIGQSGRDGADGKDGIAGTNGKDGVDGQDGRNGTNGHDGANGHDGTDGAQGPGLAYGWTDPVTGKVWHILGWGGGATSEEMGCNVSASANWGIPTLAQAQAAIADGIFSAGGPNEMWLPSTPVYNGSGFLIGQDNHWVGADSVYQTAPHSNWEQHGRYCVSQ